MPGNILLLNIDNSVLNIISLRRAVNMIINNKAVSVKTEEKYIYKDFLQPSVVRMNYWIYVPWRPMNLNKLNILKRDNYRCQYCNKKLSFKSATIDHVIPKSRIKNFHQWKNVVSCCKECNNKKGDKTPEEAFMKLLNKPRTPKRMQLFDNEMIKKRWGNYQEKYIWD